MWSRVAQYGSEVGPALSRWKDQVIFRDLFQPKLDSVFDGKLSLSVGKKTGAREWLFTVFWKGTVIRVKKSKAGRFGKIPLLK